MSDDHAGPALDPDDLDISKSEYVRPLGENRYVVSAGARPPRVPPVTESERSDDTAQGSPDDTGSTEPTDATTPAETQADTATTGTPTAGSSDRTSRPASPQTPQDNTPEPTPDTGVSPQSGPPTTPPKQDATPRQGVKRGAPSRDGSPSTDSDDIDAAAVGRWLAESLSNTEFAYGFDATLSVEDEAVRHRMVSNDVTTTFETLALWFARAAAGDDADVPPERALGILLAEMDGEVTLPAAGLRKALDHHDLDPDDSIADLLAAVDRDGGLTLD